jgi:predicted alpha/beta hydrolase family esterase
MHPAASLHEIYICNVMKEIFFVHSAGPQNDEEGSNNFVSHLSKSLGEGYRVHNPCMPHPENPRYQAWKMALQSNLPVGGNKTALVGHSLGGSVIVKYLSEGLVQMPIGGLFLIGAPFWGTKGWTVDEFMFEQGFELKIPAIEKIFIYHSRGDKFVPFSHGKVYTKILPGATLRTIAGDDHEFSNGLSELVKDIKSLW